MAILSTPHCLTFATLFLCFFSSGLAFKKCVWIYSKCVLWYDSRIPSCSIINLVLTFGFCNVSILSTLGNFNIHAAQEISVFNEMKRYQIWLRPKGWVQKISQTIPPNLIKLNTLGNNSKVVWLITRLRILKLIVMYINSPYRNTLAWILVHFWISDCLLAKKF